MELYKLSKREPQENYESHGVFLDAPPMIPLLPETHLVIPTQASTQFEEDTHCIVDSGTSHTILRDRAYFRRITPSQRKVTTIMGQHQLEEGYGPATLQLPRGTIIHIESAIFAPKATRNLLSFKDIRKNRLHIQTAYYDSKEVLQLVTRTPTGIQVRETLNALPYGFYSTQAYCYHTGNEINRNMA